MSRGIGLPMDGVPNQGWKLYITSLVMIVAAGSATVARCATRVHTRQLGLDDYVIVCSLMCSIILSVAIQLAVANGYGMHRTDLTQHELLTALRWFFIAQTPYKVVVGLNKVSAIVFYQRIFIGKGFQIACWTCMGIVVGWNIGAIAATIWQCVPAAGSWDKSVDAKCINSRAFWTAYAVGNILTDAMVIVLPIPQVLKLQLRVREKVMLCGVFLLGGIVLIAGIVRTTAVQSSLAKQQDLTYNFIPRGIWTLIESNLGIITPCLPILKKPFNAVWSKSFGTTKNSPSSHTAYASGQSRQRNFQGKNTDKQMPRSEVRAAGRPSARDTRTRKDSDDDVELLRYGEKATDGIDGSGIVRKDSWTVTVDVDVLERSAHSGTGLDAGVGPSH